MHARQVPLLVRLLYFILIGVWIGGVAAHVGWFLCVTVVGLPFGIWVLHRVPLVTTLTMPDEEYVPIRTADDYRRAPPGGVPFLLRVVWFALAGWWLAYVWINLAFLLAATFILAPVGFWMINRVPAILTLEGV